MKSKMRHSFIPRTFAIVLPHNRRFHFPAMDGDVGCGFHTDSHLVALNFDNDNFDLAVVDDDRFVAVA